MAELIRIVVADSHPSIERVIVVDPDITVGELVITVHTALGLEPSPPGRLIVADNEHGVYDFLDSSVFEALFASSGVVTYVPSTGDWKLQLTPLGDVDAPVELPSLVDATGPDLITSLGSASAMTHARQALIALLNGRPPEPIVEELLDNHFHTENPFILVDRLTECFEPDIAIRLAELSDSADPLNELEPRIPQPILPPSEEKMLSDIIEKFPEFSSAYPLPEVAEDTLQMMSAQMAKALTIFDEADELTEEELLPPEVMRKLVRAFDLEYLGPSESDYSVLMNLHSLFLEANLLEHKGRKIRLTREGKSALKDPRVGFTAAMLFYLPLADSPADTLGLNMAIALLLRGDEEATTFIMNGPSNMPFINLELFQLLGVATIDPEISICPGHEGFFGSILERGRKEFPLD